MPRTTPEQQRLFWHGTRLELSLKLPSCAQRLSTRRDMWYPYAPDSHFCGSTRIPDLSLRTGPFWARDSFNESSIPCHNSRGSSGMIWGVWRKHSAVSYAIAYDSGVVNSITDRDKCVPRISNTMNIIPGTWYACTPETWYSSNTSVTKEDTSRLHCWANELFQCVYSSSPMKHLLDTGHWTLDTGHCIRNCPPIARNEN